MEVQIWDAGRMALGKVLGTGAFGLVRLASCDGQVQAVKRLKRTAVSWASTRQEVRLLQLAESPFIVRVHQLFSDLQYYYIAQEALLGGDWFGKKATLVEAQFAAACVLSALEELHGKSILFADLKTENTVRTTFGVTKLVDAGSAVILKEKDRSGKVRGTLQNCALEMIQGKPYWLSADLWSFGCFVFEILNCRAAFDAEDDYGIIKKISSRQYIHGDGCCASANCLIDLCLSTPAKRASLDKLKALPFFDGLDFEALNHGSLVPPSSFSSPDVVQHIDEEAVRENDFEALKLGFMFVEENLELACAATKDEQEAAEDLEIEVEKKQSKTSKSSSSAGVPDSERADASVQEETSQPPSTDFTALATAVGAAAAGVATAVAGTVAVAAFVPAAAGLTVKAAAVGLLAFLPMPELWSYDVKQQP